MSPDRIIRWLGTAFAFSACLAAVPAAAQSTGTMLSDLWWNASEPGWGVTVDEQESFLFLTFFVHRADGSPYWVTAQLLRTTAGSGVTFPLSFAGDVYETAGTDYGKAWNPSAKSDRKAGTATFTATAVDRATLDYTIDGATVRKAVTRQTLVAINFAGNYLGGMFWQLSNCTPSSLNGQVFTDTGILTVNQSGSTLTIAAQGYSATCSFGGTYAQDGQMGRTTGTYTCSDGTKGTFTLSAMQWTVAGMSARLDGQSPYCTFSGALGGATGNHIQ